MLTLFFKHPRGFLSPLEILHDPASLSFTPQLLLIFCFNLVQSPRSSIRPRLACCLCLSAFACAVPVAEKTSLPF